MVEQSIRITSRYGHEARFIGLSKGGGEVEEMGEEGRGRGREGEMATASDNFSADFSISFGLFSLLFFSLYFF